MKTIGLIGGMSWESTELYYRIINETVKENLGGLHSAKCLLYSVNFEEIEKYQSTDQWEKSAEVLTEIAKKLEDAGADFIGICTNTMHKTVPYMEKSINIPILHIAEATVEEIKAQNIKKVALLGTKYTMIEDFYKEKILESGIEVIIPNEDDIKIINDIIYDELCLGKVEFKSKEKYLKIIEKMKNQGVKGVILGCTEIGLLISQKDVDIKVFDTTKIHAKKIALNVIKN
ncbi:aspartate/glutamate racemase family protein [Pseudoleptotrichia goodfellowii]|uniref:Aspartate racemase n=1 Tax=Pseudoleptotrichia goodfellowii F0264 TaxID=596323 RepID=D0GNN3_9FUSO|nr:aspartate/glutamate racemase family protein [Pseudoleptotrichia goodfellowii]EEY34342.1 aspartate racemase [Pseudoleptotrichia goodfellowii F0264]